MKKTLSLVIVAVMLLTGLCSCQSGKKDDSGLVIYTSHADEALAYVIEQFNLEYPDIKVTYVIDSSNGLLAKIREEAKNPVCDVMWGVNADLLDSSKRYLEPYSCAQDGDIPENYKATDDRWTGESISPIVFVYNKKLVAEEDVPATWEGLLNPNLKGKIAFADPNHSGIAYYQLCTMIKSYKSETQGWEYVSRLVDALDGRLYDDDYLCYDLVSAGECAIGVTLEQYGMLSMDNPDVEMVYPENTSLLLLGMALIKGCDHPENAKLFLEFASSAKFQAKRAKYWHARSVNRNVVEKKMVNISTLSLISIGLEYTVTKEYEILQKWGTLTIVDE